MICTYIIDGSEQPVRCPKNKIMEGLFYSSKKGWHSINILVRIAFNGVILGLSPSHPGSINDNELLKRDRHWRRKNLRLYEYGIGDGGFKGLTQHKIIAPPPRFTPRHAAFAHYRIKVENAIANIKNFAITSAKLRIPLNSKQNILDFHQKAWVIASVFVNNTYKL